MAEGVILRPSGIDGNGIMRLKYIKIRHFGKLKDKEVKLKNGINIIYGPNESGKSTIHSFIRGMFFGIERYRGRASKNDPYTRYEPWDRPVDYGGALGFSVDGKEFCVERNFYKKDIRQSLVCENDREQLSIPHGDLQMLLGGISENVYDNTVSIGQLKSETDSGLVRELENYMSNFSEAGTADVDISRAEDVLKKKKKQWEGQRKSLEKQWGKQQENIEQQLSYTQDEIYNLEQQLQKAEQKKIMLEAEQNETHEEKSREIDEEREKEEKRRSELQKQIQEEKEEKRKEILRYRQEDQKIAQKNDSIWKILLVLSALLILGGIAGSGTLPAHVGLILAIAGVVIMIGSSLYQMSFIKKEKSRRMAREENLHNQWMDLMQQERNLDQTLPGKSVFEEKDILKMTTIPSEDMISRLEGQKEMLSQQIAEKNTMYENLLETRDEIVREPEEIKACKKEIESLELAMEIMGKLSQNIRRRIGVRLQNRMEEILGEITNGKYNRISMDEKMKITLYEWNRAVPLYQVSRGTVEQVYFALRMAVTDVLCQEPMPVMLDDVFAMYDEDRLIQTLKWLEKRGGQVLLFTCHKREMELVEKAGIRANIIMMEEKAC